VKSNELRNLTMTITSKRLPRVACVSFYGVGGVADIWQNGACQNYLLICEVLARLPSIKRVYLVDFGSSQLTTADLALLGIRAEVAQLEDVIDQVDLLVEAGAKLSAETVQRVRDRGGRAVSYRIGNDYIIDIERAIFDLPGGSLYFGSRFDEVWVSPQHVDTAKSYYEMTFRCPVRTVPFIWCDHFLQAGIMMSTLDEPYGYQPGRATKRVSIFEPNHNVIKTSHYPMLVCEQAFRQQRELFEAIYVTNTERLRSHGGFVPFAQSLDMVTEGCAHFEDRYPTPAFMAGFTDVVVTHQWENSLNYLYFDALWGGYPLVHNSPALRGYGYYYKSFDAKDGGRVLLEAIRQHDARLPLYQRQSAKLLWSVNAFNPRNILGYEQAVRAVFART